MCTLYTFFIISLFFYTVSFFIHIMSIYITIFTYLHFYFYNTFLPLLTPTCTITYTIMSILYIHSLHFTALLLVCTYLPISSSHPSLYRISLHFLSSSWLFYFFATAFFIFLNFFSLFPSYLPLSLFLFLNFFSLSFQFPQYPTLSPIQFIPTNLFIISSSSISNSTNHSLYPDIPSHNALNGLLHKTNLIILS